MNFALMYLLAKTPASAAKAGSGNIIARLFDENTLKGMGAPGARARQHCSTFMCSVLRWTCALDTFP
jgi:hypothetical protein